MAGEQDAELQHLASAFFAMEPTDILLSFARACGGGLITESVQRFIWDHCLKEAVGDVTNMIFQAEILTLYTKKSRFLVAKAGKCHPPYLQRFLKKLIRELESNNVDVMDELYKLLTNCLISSKEENWRALKYISFLFPDGGYGLKKLVVPLQCSLNMLEGDTGCSIWPSSLFLSEFILSNPQFFSNKSCFEVGSGVGLVGICLAHVKASRVILSDGDLSTLANMQLNLNLNHLNIEENDTINAVKSPNTVRCIHLSWESATESGILDLDPDIIVGADVIYDPSCIPHLVRILSTLLHQRKNRVAYIASVIRNPETFDCFLGLVSKARISIKDMTDSFRPINLIPYMKSYDRSSVLLFELSAESS